MSDDSVIRMTQAQADEEVLRYKELYPVVDLLDAETIANESHCLLCSEDCPCMRKVADEVLRNGGEQSHSLHMGDAYHRATARYMEVDGEPRVFLYSSPIQLETT